jgi:cell division protein FtsI (penicillin-binding protein 3)
MRSRIVLILIALTGLWMMMIGRAAYLQLIPDARLKSLQKRQFETVVTLNPRRGDVVDRNGHELAVSMTSYSLFADPKILEEPKKVARLLSRELKVPLRQIEDKLRNRRKRFVWIQRHVDKPLHDVIAARKIRGLGFVEESRRVYPNDRLLSHVLGFVGREESGLEGLELKYDDHLEAAQKKVAVRKDARGRPLIVNGQMFHQVPDGADIQLTIDRELQFVVEQELAQTVEKHEADSAVAIVLDAQTSEILAMAASPSFDPNRHADFSLNFKRNRTITDSYEPGSTLKTFVIAGALNEGLVEPNTRFDGQGGAMRVGKRIIREADDKHRFKMLTVSEILAVSSNVGTTKIALKMGQDRVERSLRAFGFGERSGVDLPGEVKGIIQARPWHDHLLANVSFGHGITATALQVANAYAAIANGGVLNRPFIVKTIRDHESGETIDRGPQEIRRALSPEAAAKMRLILTGVTSDGGTGINARVPGFPVAGKTGTAQKVNPHGRGYLPGGYISSFAGFLPANDPKFVIYVAVDHPRKEYYGSAVAAPVFSRVAKFAVRRAGLSPVLITQANVVPQSPLAGQIQSRPLSRAVGVAPSLGGDGLPKVPGETALVAGRAPAGTATTVPELTGLTLREVLGRVTGTGISIKIRGRGFVTHTTPEAGELLSSAREITVHLAPESEKAH